jgi:hypothetical protein
MKKWIFSLSLVFMMGLSGTEEQRSTHHSHQEKLNFFTAQDVDYVHPDSLLAGQLKVRGMQIEGFDPAAEEKLEQAFRLLEKVMNSRAFREKVINFKNTQGRRSYASNKGMSNEEIYEHLMEGREDLQPNTPGEMNFYLKLYHRPWSKVIGWTTPDVNLININWKFFKNFTPHQVAANLAHEWAHKMGFGHKSAAEHDSVPYAIGYIVEELGRQHNNSVTLH